MKLTEKDITASVARQMREDAGLSQKAFWEPLGVQQSVGCKYEQDVKIPRSVRILIVARYVVGFKIDAGSQDGVQELAKLGKIQSAKMLASSVRADIDSASKKLDAARDALSTL